MVAAVRARVPHHHAGFPSSGSGSNLGAPSVSRPGSGGSNRSSPRTSIAAPKTSAAGHATNNTNNNNNIHYHHAHESKETTIDTIHALPAAAAAAAPVTPTTPATPATAAAAAATNVRRGASPPSTPAFLAANGHHIPSLPSPAEAEKHAREMVKQIEAEIAREHNRLMDMIATDGGGSVHS